MPSIHHILGFLVQIDFLGLFLLAVADDSFLFLPVGSDLLTVILVAKHHGRFALYVFAAALGSMAGVFLLDLVCRKGGQEGLKRLVKPAQLERLKARIEKNGMIALIVACLAPPPFPFGAYIAAASAFQYPRPRLLGVVFAARLARFALVAWAAIYFGRGIIKFTESSGFLWFMGIFIAICLIGSIVSIVNWVRISRSR